MYFDSLYMLFFDCRFTVCTDCPPDDDDSYHCHVEVVYRTELSTYCGCIAGSSGLSMVQQQSEEREKRSEWIGGGNVV